MRELCVIEADGIGHEVVPAALRVLQTVLPDLVVHHAQAGWDYFQATQRPIDPETIDLIRQCGALLYGAANSPSYPVPGYKSPVVMLRRALNAYASLRPTTYMPVPTARMGIDLLVVREATEDVYIAQETRQTVEGGETGTAMKFISSAATERIARRAYTLATQAKRRLITIVHKANVLPQTDGLFRKVCLQVAQDYPDIQTDELLVDTAAYWMVKEPTRFDVILTINQYGDILSDMAAAWGGGLGLAPALNLGDGVAIAEPVHGSAPDIAGKGIANPTATILSTAMLARYHWGLEEAANRIETAVHQTFSDGLGTVDIRPQDGLNTHAFTDAVIARL